LEQALNRKSTKWFLVFLINGTSLWAWPGLSSDELCLGAEMAYFRNGRSMPVENHELTDQKVILILNGSDRMEFDRDWIERFSPIETPATPSNQLIQQNSPPGARQYTLEELNLIIRETAQKYQLNELLLTSIIRAESNFNPSAISTKGAQGLMQLMPETAAAYKVQNVFDAKENLQAGAKYLKDLLRHFKQDLVLALAAYNAGPATVTSYKGIPPFAETQGYVRRVLNWIEIRNKSD
jgi:soluble lytic murein transglycosylase-like protein